MAGIPAATLVAIGRVEPGGTWVGFARLADGRYVAARGDGAGTAVLDTAGDRSRADLLAMATAYFTEVLADAPPDLEATQGDIAELLRWLTATAPDAEQRHRLQEAVDGVDDGLAADVVIARLTAALAAADPDRAPDALDRLSELPLPAPVGAMET